MNLLLPLFWAACAVLVSAVLQGRVSHAIHIRWAQPDFVLLTLACAGVLIGGGRAALLGLWAGLLTASLVPATFGTLLTSRILAGAMAGYLHRFMMRDSLFVPPLVVFTVTLTASVVHVLMAPNIALNSLHLWLYQTGGEVLYNTVLALPVYFLLRRLGLGKPPEDPFGVRS
jgi:rod shape-determining protein MreD